MDPPIIHPSDPNENRQVRRPGMALKSARKESPPGLQVAPVNPRPDRPISTASKRAGDEHAFRDVVRPHEIRPHAGPSQAVRPSNAGSMRTTKQSSRPARPVAPRPPVVPRQGGQQGDAPRKIVRKMASTVPTSQNQPRSSFMYTAPLLRRIETPTKSAPGKPVFLALHERAAQRTPRKNAKDDMSLGTRSAPRMSAAATSVQPRSSISQRKAPAPLIDPLVERRRLLPSQVYSRQNREQSSSSSEDSDSDDIPPRLHFGRPAAEPTRSTQGRQVGVKAARKTPSAVDRLMKPLGKAARKLRISSDVEDSDVEVSDPGEDLSELLDAFDALTAGPQRLLMHRRLPFLLRNLRKGFENHCVQTGIPVHPEEKLEGSMKVVYRYYPDGYEEDEESADEDQEYQEWTGTLTEWGCPLCQLHRPFKTRRMLVAHLDHDHEEVKVSWTELDHRNGRRWRMVLILPDYDELEESSSDEEEEEEEEEEAQEAQDVVQDIVKDQSELQEVEAVVSFRERTQSTPVRVQSVRVREPLFLPSSDDEETPLPEALRPVTPPPPPPKLEVKPKVLDEESSTAPATRQSSSRVSRPRASVAARASYRGSLPPRYPSPPPPTDPLGPAAQYPYLPETDGEGRSVYSCRIGGPRIYDLLNELSLDKFGIMSWAIVDREEELFEMEDVRDEDKVMLALWNRWIMLNKSSFIFEDYSKGVKRFLDRYWEMIHRAAGWRALRAFLVMLNVNRYLSFKEVLEVLEYYEEKTGMKMWYQEDAEEDEA